VTRGCFIINKLGGAEVKVSDFGRAARSLGLIFETGELRSKALSTIEGFLPEAKARMQDKMKEFGGQISAVEYVQVEIQLGFHLYLDFVTDFHDARGHGATSLAVGYIKKEIEALLRSEGIDLQLSVIAQGYDGDLKPSPRNKRGRYASVQVRASLQEFQDVLKVNPDKFLAFVETDRIGSQKLGCPFYSGMGGEIIPAIYRATKVNPRSSLVSSFQNIYAAKNKGDIIYGVELPNVEAGVISSCEGLIPPTGREALRIMGIKTAKEFAAAVASQVLAGEFNLALEISREKLYS
jgi:hydroxymethylglutaryl-CoA reductase